MAYDPLKGGSRPGPASSIGGFDRLKAGLSDPTTMGMMTGGMASGFGEGMMDPKFRQAYNAGQGGLSNLYGVSRMGKGLSYMKDLDDFNQEKAVQQKGRIAIHDFMDLG